ncbi:hypothetical protein GF374_03120, partial [Candidatus Woesearchaeota archaeon]|nr:hypothetical protein [Candidatus Woesearchaeota archaeon]
MTVKDIYLNYKIQISLIIVVIIVAIIGLGIKFLPTLFYDQWIWKYYWGPVVSDAAGHPVSWNGIVANEGYTLISELTYGIILIFALFAIY